MTDLLQKFDNGNDNDRIYNEDNNLVLEDGVSLYIDSR